MHLLFLANKKILSLLPATYQLHSIISFSVETMLLFLFLTKREQKSFLGEQKKYTMKNVMAKKTYGSECGIKVCISIV